jgi:hypothetical protein
LCQKYEFVAISYFLDGFLVDFLAVFWRDPLLVLFLGVFRGKNGTKSGFRQILDFGI